MAFDPDRTLGDIRRLYAQLIRNGGKAAAAGDGNRLAAAVMDLDEWLGQGGTLPRAWEFAITHDQAAELNEEARRATDPTQP